MEEKQELSDIGNAHILRMKCKLCAGNATTIEHISKKSELFSKNTANLNLSAFKLDV